MENVKKLNYDWCHVSENETNYMLGVAFIDGETMVTAYRPIENVMDIVEWWEIQGLKKIIQSQYDCTGSWFSAYQEHDDTTIYDIQYMDV